MARPYDVILYGATGFTGRQTAAWFAAHAPAGLRWAIAGRSREKLAQVASELGQAVDLIAADSADPASVDAMAAQTGVLLSTAGPFARLGDPVVAACVAHGVHYVDITGETPWVRRIIDRHHEEARAKAIRIVPCCGFDSVPSDLGAWMMVSALKAQGRTPRAVRSIFSAKGGFNGGTLASMLNLMGGDEQRALADPVLLNPEALRTREQRAANRDQRSAAWDPVLQRWTAPFFMAPVNTRVVRRSAALSAGWGEPWGEDFRYSESMGVGRSLSWLSATAVTGGLGLFFGLSKSSAFRAALERLGPAPGEGPSEAVMDGGWTKTRYIAEDTEGGLLQGEFFSPGDPGNRVTVAILCSAAVALVEGAQHLPGGAGRGGVLTPATALGTPLLDRLRAAGMRWEVASGEEP